MFNRNKGKNPSNTSSNSTSSLNYGSSNDSSHSNIERRWTLKAIAAASNGSSASLTAFEVVSEISSRELDDTICALTVSDNYIYIASKSGKLTIWEELSMSKSNNIGTSPQGNSSTRGFGFRKNVLKMKLSQEFKKAKKIRSMAVCRDLEIMVAVLNDGHYICVNSKSLSAMNDSTIPSKTRHAEYVIADFKPPYYRCVIGSKKNLYLFEWDKNASKFSFIREISLGETAISVVFYNDYLCYSALKSGYKMHHIKNGNEKEIMVPLQPNVVPRMAKILFNDDNGDMKTSDNDKDSGHLLVQATPEIGIFVDENGAPAQMDTVGWEGTPAFIIECSTYIIGYLENNAIQIISLVDQKTVQKLSVYNPRYHGNNVFSGNPADKFPLGKDDPALLATNAQPQTRNNAFSKLISKDKNNDKTGGGGGGGGGDDTPLDSEDILKNSNVKILGLDITQNGHVIIYDSEQVFALVPTPPEQQIEECIKYLRIEKGLQLLMKQSPTRLQFQEFQCKSGFALLKNLQFKRAMEHFDQSNVDPRDIIQLFPKIRLENLEYTIQHSAAPKNRTINEMIEEVIMFKRSQQVDNISKETKMNTNRLVTGVRAATVYHDMEIEVEYLHGLLYLGIFLWKRRSEPSSKDMEITDAEQKLAIDTALLKIYVELTCNVDKLSKEHSREKIDQELLTRTPFEIEDLLRNKYFQNACLESECQKLLILEQRYYYLALLYYSKNHLKQALQALHQIGSGTWIDLSGKYNIEDAMLLTVEILSKLDDCSELWNYSQWVLIKSPSLGMKIFTNYGNSNENYRKNELNPDKVLNFLKEDIIQPMLQQKQEQKAVKGTPSGYGRSRGGGVSNDPLKMQKSLHGMNFELFDDIGTIDENDALIRQAEQDRRNASVISSASHESTHGDNNAFDFDYIECYLEYLVIEKEIEIPQYHDDLAFLYMKKIQDLTTKGKAAADDDDEKKDDLSFGVLNVTRQKLLKFLAKSNLYLPDKLLEHAKMFELHEEVIELNKKLGKDEEVLKTLVNEIQNHDRAVAFCMDAPENSRTRSQRFIYLLKLYLLDIIPNTNVSATSSLNNNDENENNNMDNGDSGFDFQTKEEIKKLQNERFLNGMSLLEEHTFDMSHIKVLNLLPKGLKIYEVKKYFRKLIPNILHQQRQTGIRKELYKCKCIKTQETLTDVKSQYVRIGETSYCDKCGKNIGSTVFVLDPKKKAKYHLSCFYKKEQTNDAIINDDFESTRQRHRYESDHFISNNTSSKPTINSDFNNSNRYGYNDNNNNNNSNINSANMNYMVNDYQNNDFNEINTNRNTNSNINTNTHANTNNSNTNPFFGNNSVNVEQNTGGSSNPFFNDSRPVAPTSNYDDSNNRMGMGIGSSMGNSGNTNPFHGNAPMNQNSNATNNTNPFFNESNNNRMGTGGNKNPFLNGNGNNASQEQYGQTNPFNSNGGGGKNNPFL